MKLTALFLFFISLCVHAEYGTELVKDNLGIVWGIEFLDNDIIVTERKGVLKRVSLKTKKVTVITGAPEVYAKGQGGLLDIKLHPNFKNNKRVYLTYSKSLAQTRTTALGYGVLEGNKLKDFTEIFVAKGKASKRIHFGSRITFTNDNKIFLSVGERGQRSNAQDLSNNFGKIMRLNDDGSIPGDNPFLKDSKKLNSIWSYGHRNPQGLFYDKSSKTLYEMEHGPRGGDEINIIQKGANFGWPLASYGKEYWNPLSVGKMKVSGTVQPIKYYVPSIAPSGLIMYNGDKFSKLKGSLISGALALTHLNIYNPKTKTELRLFEKIGMRVRSVNADKRGDIYFSTDAGKIYKLKLK